jgi:hypothetical protein
VTMKRRPLSDLDRGLARLLAQALVKDYRQFPPSHDAPTPMKRLDSLLPDRYQAECLANGDGPARLSNVSGTNGAGASMNSRPGSAVRGTPSQGSKPAAGARRSRSSSGSPGPSKSVSRTSSDREGHGL